MSRCKCTRGVATEWVKFDDGHMGFVCKACLERVRFEKMGKEERLAYLKKLEAELEYKESGKKPTK